MKRTTSGTQLRVDPTPPPGVECPRCGSPDVRRSQRRWHEDMLAIVGSFPFRCDVCTHRFFARSRG